MSDKRVIVTEIDVSGVKRLYPSEGGNPICCMDTGKMEYNCKKCGEVGYLFTEYFNCYTRNGPGKIDFLCEECFHEETIDVNFQASLQITFL